MKQFEYRAIDKKGVISTGIIESVSAVAAAKSLQERNLLVVNIKEKRTFSLKNISFGNRVSEREIATFTRLLATMLSTGLPLTESISNLINQTTSSYFRQVLQTVLHDIQSGTTLSESLGRDKKTFNELYINLVKAGEAAGKVDGALSKLADTLEANLEFKAKIQGAMIYPFVIVIVMVAISIFMITSIIPKIADVYNEFKAELPLPTRILVGISDFAKNYTILLIIIIAFVIFSVKTLKKNPAVELMFNNLMLKVPIIGPLNQEVALALINRTLGTLLSSGVAILDALVIVSKTVDNNCFRVGLLDAKNFVEKGLPLSIAIKRNPDFPPMMSQLLSIGEETGTIDQSLERVARFYQDSAERKVKNLTTLLEPIMILVMGIMVAGLAIAVLMPMFNLVNVIK